VATWSNTLIACQGEYGTVRIVRRKKRNITTGSYSFPNGKCVFNLNLIVVLQLRLLTTNDRTHVASSHPTCALLTFSYPPPYNSHFTVHNVQPTVALVPFPFEANIASGNCLRVRPPSVVVLVVQWNSGLDDSRDPKVIGSTNEDVALELVQKKQAVIRCSVFVNVSKRSPFLPFGSIMMSPLFACEGLMHCYETVIKCLPPNQGRSVLLANIGDPYA
jgi:hypothetical protein